MEKKSPFTHILIPTDGSDNSVHAGRLAIEMAGLHHSQVTLVYVVDSATVDEIAAATAKTSAAISRELEIQGRRYLDYLLRLAGASNVQAEQMILHGTPYREIAELARERDVDLIVIGRVGCRGARCALVGSVAERVIEYAQCPVLVVSNTPPRR
ncbi:MAG: universal stress protein [Anaerolineae bacterium]|nr:universal stress protein [Anaerolineae bacterium]